MNSALEHLALRKQLLQARSTLYRLRIRSELDAMHGSLSWALRHSRLARALGLAARVLLFARLARSASRLWRSWSKA
jgi:hypothetical protein